MKTKNHNKITKTIIAEALVWSQKANGLPKQEIIDQIFTGLNRGYIKKAGEQVTENTYTDKGSDTQYQVDFAKKTIQVGDKQLITFTTAEEKPKAEKAPKAEKPIKGTKQPKLTKEEKLKAAMEAQRQDIKGFLEKNFELDFNEEGKIKRFRLTNKDDKQMGVDVVLGGVILCVLINVKDVSWQDAEAGVKWWMKGQRSANDAAKASVNASTEEKTEAEPVADVTAKSPSPRTTAGSVANKKKAKRNKK